MANPRNSDDARQNLDSFRRGDLGVPFDALQRFATPILELFAIDTLAGDDTATDEELNDIVCALETARLFWSYFGSGGPASAEMTDRLQSVLFGTRPSFEEQAAFAALVDRLAAKWDVLPLVVRRDSGGRSGAAGFYGLVAALESANGGAGGNGSGDPADASRNVIDSPEALAAFASPLLEDPAVGDDPDRISDLMAKAQAYWDLAVLSGNEFESELRHIVDTFSTTQEEKEAIVSEASFMVARFHKLFPYWTNPD